MLCLPSSPLPSHLFHASAYYACQEPLERAVSSSRSLSMKRSIELLEPAFSDGFSDRIRNVDNAGGS